MVKSPKKEHRTWMLSKKLLLSKNKWYCQSLITRCTRRIQIVSTWSEKKDKKFRVPVEVISQLHCRHSNLKFDCMNAKNSRSNASLSYIPSLSISALGTSCSVKWLSCGNRQTWKFTRRPSSSSYKSNIQLRKINPSNEQRKPQNPSSAALWRWYSSKIVHSKVS